jgi:hypothetical protein
MTLAVVVTYSRIDPTDTYNVSREGFAGGLSRAITLLNFPIALVAIALALVAVAALPRAAWWVAVPAIAFCATIPWFVDQDDLDARRVNAIPVLGVVLAAALTVAATVRVGSSFAPRLAGDRLRVIVAVVVLLASLLGDRWPFHFPGDVFMGENWSRATGAISPPFTGHHHGTDGASSSPDCRSRARLARQAADRRFRRISDDAGYGAVNAARLLA